MDTRKIRKLIELVKETGIGELEVSSGEESVRISATLPAAAVQPVQQIAAAPVAAPAAIPAPAASTEKAASKPADEPADPANLDGHKVKSPMVGTVYLAATPGAKPFVAVGDRVEIGDTLCMIEAMKMFNKIEADATGIVSARLIENETPVEYDQPLFIIDTGE